MRNSKEDFGKYEKQMARLERLTQLACQRPFMYMERMKKAEQELYRMIENDRKKSKEEKTSQRKAA